MEEGQMIDDWADDLNWFRVTQLPARYRFDGNGDDNRKFERWFASETAVVSGIP